jgi:alpha/beta superfamily hydrolase
MSEVTIRGLEGRIEGKYHHSDDQRPNVALILHAHPLQGGNMNSTIIHRAYNDFVKRDFSVARFNFRGVGKSEGEFDNGIGELGDAATVLDWLQNHNPVSESLWIVGFSFGAWIAMQMLMRRPEIDNFLAISLPINKYDFSFLSPCPTSGFVIHGDQDSIVPAEDLVSFIDSIHKQKGVDIECSIIPKADHFFRERLDALDDRIVKYIDFRLNQKKETKVKIDLRRRQVRQTNEFKE